MKLSVKIGNIEFRNPVTVASGTFGYVKKYYDNAQIQRLGAITLKTITLKAREGNPSPRVAETSFGMLNAIGIENQGIDHFLENKLSQCIHLKTKIIASIMGYEDEEWMVMAKKIHTAKKINAVELNLSCPNLNKKRLIAQDAKETYRVIQLIKKFCQKPVIAKLSPNVTDITVIAKAAEEAGADAVSLVNTFAAMAIDINTQKPILGNITGGLSGPAIKPIALKMVYDVYRAVRLPIIAMGGIMKPEDALEFIIAGATMVSVGTASFLEPRLPLEVLSGIKAYMQKKKIKNINELIGSIKVCL